MAKLEFGKEMRTQWIVFVGIFFMCFSAMGLGSNSFGIFTVPITEALDMPRATYNTFESVSKIVGMVMAALFSTIYRKVGPKGSVLIAGGGYIVQYVLFAIADSLPLLLVGGFFAGIGYTFAAQMTVFAVIPPWFKKGAGTITSILSACNTFGTTVWTYFLVKWLATDGYRSALLYSAVIIAVMCLISAFLVKASPDDPLYGDAAASGSGDGKLKAVAPLTNRELLKIPVMWMLIAIYFIVAAIGHPFTANIPAFANAKGLSAATGAAGYALCYALMGPAKIVVGIIKDRFGGAKSAVLMVFTFFIVACLSVMLPVSERVYVLATGIGHGVGGTMSQLLIAFVVLDTFGKYYHPGQIGLCLVMFNIGRAIGMPAVHLEYDMTGSYTITMTVLIALAVIVVILTFASLSMGKKWQAKRDLELAAAAKE
ncbi:MAG: MFS transporter [Synergistaceae bacterium]|nr:MFS transporter [Synergistaceae bacterium]